MKNAYKGLKTLRKLTYSFQVSGKFNYAVKGNAKTAEIYSENKEYEVAENILT